MSFTTNYTLEKLETLEEAKLLITAITQIAFAVLGAISFAYTYHVWSRKQINSVNETSLILFGKLVGVMEFLLSVIVFFLCFPWQTKLPSKIRFTLILMRMIFVTVCISLSFSIVLL